MSRKIIGVTVGTPLDPQKIAGQSNANAIVNSATGKTILTTDSANAPLVNLKAKGDIWQKQYEGHQLFDISKMKLTNKQSSNQGDVTEIGDNYIIITTKEGYVGNGFCDSYVKLRELCPDLVVGETYTIMANTKSSDKSIYVGETWTLGTSKVMTESILNYSVVFYGFNSPKDGTGNCKISDITIVKGTVAKPWEPYVGGQPSPSMEYEQPIESLENVEVKVIGKNWFDVEKSKDANNWVLATNNGHRGFVIQGQPHATYTISAEKIKDVTDYVYIANSYSDYFDDKGNKLLDTHKNVTWLWHTSGFTNANNSATVTTDGTGKILILHARYNLIETFLTNIQIELGSEATEYEPYIEQTLTLTSPVPITKWDKLVKRDGIWGWSIYHLNLIIDGTFENGRNSSYKGFYYANALPQKMMYRDGFCNAFFVRDNYYTNECVWLGSDNDFIYLPNSSFWDDSLVDSGRANLKAHLNEHPLEIMTYADEEQGFIPLSDAEQEMIKSVLMNYPTTTILSNAELEVEYVADTKNYIDNKFKELEANVTSAIAQLL